MRLDAGGGVEEGWQPQRVERGGVDGEERKREQTQKEIERKIGRDERHEIFIP